MLLFVPRPAGASVVSVLPSGALDSIGSQVTVRFRISGLTAALGDSLSGFDINVLFDPMVLTLQSSSFLDPSTGINQLDLPEIGAFPFLGSVTSNGPGVLDAFGVSGNTATFLDSNQPNVLVFLNLTFRAIAVQTTTVALDLQDPNLLVANSSALPLTPTYGVTSAVFQPQGAVPEPRTYLLVGMGISVLLVRVLLRRSVRKGSDGITTE